MAEKLHEVYHLEQGYYFSDTFVGYSRSHAIEKFKEWLTARGIDPEKVRIVHTHSKQQPELYHTFQFIFRINEKGDLDRPKCPECGSSHVISRGKEWYCRKCGRYYSKIYKSKPPKRTINNIKKQQL